MIDKILECNADWVKEVKVDDIIFNTNFRKACEENKCGSYGNNYTCPPYCGSADDLTNKVKRYKTAYVFSVVEKINGYEDTDGIKRTEQRIAELADKIDDCAKLYCKDYLVIGGGPCRKCSPCKKTKSEPCPTPDKAFISLSAFCIDTAKLTQSCGIKQSWDGSEISYIGLLLV